MRKGYSAGSVLKVGYGKNAFNIMEDTLLSIDVPSINQGSRLKTAIVYDPHAWSEARRFNFFIDEDAWVFKNVSLSDSRDEAVLFFIADEYCLTKLPFYFPRRQRIALLKENPNCSRQIDPVVLKKRFDLVLTHREDLIQLGMPFIRVDFSSNWVMDNKAVPESICKSKLVSFIGSVQHPRKNGHAFRQDVANILADVHNVDCFGRGINEIIRKKEALADYCFSVAMENSRENYYYTEKIIDCFFTDTVPIYWGCPGIGEVFDLRGIITFETSEELLTTLDGLSFEKYYEMLPYVKANRQRCIDLGLDSFESYLLRCLKAALSHLGPSVKKLKHWQRSKPIAGIRWLMEIIFPNYPFSV